MTEGLKHPPPARIWTRGRWWWQGGTCGRRRIQIALVGLDSPPACRRCCAVIMHRRCGAVGVFRLGFVHYIGVRCKVVRTHHMPPLVPPPLSTVPSEYDRSLKSGESAWAGYASDVTAHIPQERGGAGGWDVRYQAGRALAS